MVQYIAERTVADRRLTDAEEITHGFPGLAEEITRD
jgi:hypothetical protein